MNESNEICYFRYTYFMAFRCVPFAANKYQLIIFLSVNFGSVIRCDRAHFGARRISDSAVNGQKIVRRTNDRTLLSIVAQTRPFAVCDVRNLENIDMNEISAGRVRHLKTRGIHQSNSCRRSRFHLFVNKHFFYFCRPRCRRLF